MSYVLENSTEMTALANAIRTKSGQSGSMTVSQLTTAVNGISGGGFTYTTTSSSNAGSNSNNTVITLPSALQGGGTNFILYVKCVNSSGNALSHRIFYYNSSNNTFTSIMAGASGNTYINSNGASWNNSSTKTQVKITANGNVYWKRDSADYNHVLIIY